MKNNVKIRNKNGIYQITKKFLGIFNTVWAEFEYKYQLFDYLDDYHSYYDNIEWTNVHEPYVKYTENDILSFDLCMSAKRHNIGLDISDCTFVLDDSDNGYKLVHKPYNEFIEPFKTTHCIPAWSNNVMPELCNRFDEFHNKKINEYHIDEKHFDHKYEMEEFINEHPDIQVINTDLNISPWKPYYTLIYKYTLKNIYNL